MILNKEKTVLFYSFKGGVGRTQLLLNAAKYLANKGKKILMVDFDIYAPGLSYWENFNENLKEKEEIFFLKFLIDMFEGNEINKKIYKKKVSENLYLLPVYDMTNISVYHQLLTYFSQFLYDIKSKANKAISNNTTLGDAIIEKIVDNLVKDEHYDYIFFDARTGLTEVSDVLFSSRIDLKVLISGCNMQNIKGINSVLNLMKDNGKHSILRVLSLLPDNINKNELSYLRSEASLDENPELKKLFEWHGIMEISYFKCLSLKDFDAWEGSEINENYKKQIIDIANKIEEVLEGQLIEL